MLDEGLNNKERSTLGRLVISLVGVVILVGVLFVLFQNLHTVVGVELANILKVNTTDHKSADVSTSDMKLDQPRVNDREETYSRIMLPGVGMTHEQIEMAHKKGKLKFNDWYKVPQECLASVDNPNPEVTACVNKRMKARYQYEGYLKN